MKRTAFLFFLAFAFLSGTQHAQALPKAASSPAGILEKLGFSVFPEAQAIPAFNLRTTDGKNVSINDLKGKYVFLNFWATWCPPCQKEMPSMEALYAKFGKKNFTMLAVSVRENPKTVEKFLASRKYTFPIALDPDGAVSELFVGRGIPTTYILDPQGKAIAGLVGGREWDTPEAFDAFAAILDK